MVLTVLKALHNSIHWAVEQAQIMLRKPTVSWAASKAQQGKRGDSSLYLLW